MSWIKLLLVAPISTEPHRLTDPVTQLEKSTQPGELDVLADQINALHDEAMLTAKTSLDRAILAG